MRHKEHEAYDLAATVSDGRARGTVDAVLALPGVARRGEMLLHIGIVHLAVACHIRRAM